MTDRGIKAGEKLKTALDQVVDLLKINKIVSELTSRQATPRHELLQSLLVKQQLAAGSGISDLIHVLPRVIHPAVALKRLIASFFLRKIV
ncbi:MAG: hypothetical protein ACREXY_01420 [Gammaproteobacteria bacterium]